MSRRSRLKLDGIPIHIIQRGNNRNACFYADEDYQFYLESLDAYCHDEEVKVHAYVLMTNHVHLLVTPTDGNGPSWVMKRLGQRYVQYVNRTYLWHGSLWEGRFRSSLVGEENYFLTCHRYIELNPVRANMVSHPAEYQWSSYRANAQGEFDRVLSPHSLYEELGNDATARQIAYKKLFCSKLESSLLNEIRQATNGGYVLGSDKFKREIALAIGRRTWRGVAGRPQKAHLEEGQGTLPF
jgi:putative transposase